LKDKNHVFITQYAPCQDGYRFIGPLPLPRSTDRNVSSTDTLSISANMDEAKPKITTLTGRIDITSGAFKRSLAIGSVTLQQNSPFGIRVSIRLGNHAVHYDLIFLCPVNQTRSKTRIARKSSYIEVIIPMADHVTGDGFPRYMFSTLVTDNGPVILNMPYLPIDSLPILDTSKKGNLEWLTTHTSFQDVRS
jgi:hypothetical protein